jgi:molecular chaperone IbpA
LESVWVARHLSPIFKAGKGLECGFLRPKYRLTGRRHGAGFAVAEWFRDPPCNAFRRLFMRIDYSPFFRSTVGFDRLIGLLESASEQGYPPYNIERSDENNYRVTLAVAGFAEKDLSVDVKDRVLTITGKREEAEKSAALLHQGIAGRAFERNFQLAEHVEVKAARLENGLLHVDLERIVPEEKKPRRIAINAPELKTIEGAKAAA